MTVHGIARPFLPAVFLTLSLAAGNSSAQTISVNTKRVGFLPLPGPDLIKGLWAYESGGRQYCLQTRGVAGMAVIDMTDTSNPTLVANVPGNFRKVAVFGDYAYATDDLGPTQVIDLADPTAPRVVRSTPMQGHTVRVDETKGRLYLNRNGIMDVYDLLADPTLPEFQGSWQAGAHDSRPDGDVLYAHGFQQVPSRILDVSDPSSIRQLGSLPTGNHSSDVFHTPDGRTVLLALDEAWGGHMTIYDVTHPSEPRRLTQYQATTNASIHNVEVKGIYAYVAYYQDQLRILDLTNVGEPVEVGVWDNNPSNNGALYSDAWEAIPYADAVYMNQMDDTTASPKGTHAIDFFPAFGRGSVGAGGVEPEIWWSFGPPSPGNERFALRLTNARPNTLFWLLIGDDSKQWGPLSLPISMQWIGAPNASLQVAPQRIVTGFTDAQGNARVPLPVPPGAKYDIYYAQFVVRDPGAPNPAGLATTKAGKLVVW